MTSDVDKKVLGRS